MRVVRVGKRIKHKPNLGNYEGIEVEAWAEVEFADGANIQETLEKIDADLAAHLEGDLLQVAQITDNPNTYVDELVDRPRRSRSMSRRG